MNYTDHAHIPLPEHRTPDDTFLHAAYIEWIDSASYDGWRDQDDVARLSPYRCRTVAFIVKETDVLVHVTHTETYGVDASFKKLYAGLFSIPKQAIVRLVRLHDNAQERPGIVATSDNPAECQLC